MKLTYSKSNDIVIYIYNKYMKFISNDLEQTENKYYLF